MVCRNGIAVCFLFSALGCRRDEAGKGAPSSGLLPSPTEIASAMASAGATEVNGSIHSIGGGLGTWDLVLGDCQSGDYKGFFGVDFYPKGGDHMRLRYVHDEAAGEIVKLAYPQQLDKAAVYDREATCAIREGKVEKTSESTRVPGRGYVSHLRGHLKFDCSDPRDKSRVFGEVTFAHCH